MKNFPFKHDGKEYWYSRSIAAAIFLFAEDSAGQKYVLANKRGTGGDEIGKWNCPCGYLDFNETVKQAAVREVYEETGLQINENDIHLTFINDDPDKDARQNVTFRYTGVLTEKVESLSKKLNDKHSEDNEVESIKFVKLSEINDYNWAFNHENLIREYALKLFGLTI